MDGGFCPGVNFQMRHRPDGRQRLAPKSQRVDCGQIAVRQFGRGVPLHRQFEIGGVHAVAVVGDADQLSPAGLDRHLDPPRACIESVFNEFLHGRGRPLDDFAGGDSVNQNWIEATNGHERSIAENQADAEAIVNDILPRKVTGFDAGSRLG